MNASRPNPLPPPGRPARTPDPGAIRALAHVLLAAFLLVGAGLLYWSVLRAPAILARDDNPRLVEAALRVRRGALLDRDGVLLAANAGPPDAQRRVYSTPDGHATGFTSLRYGAAGAEAAFDALLNGTGGGPWAALRRAVLHEAPAGPDVRLTLDQGWQDAAAGALDGRQGAALLLELPHDAPGQARARVLVSAPGYDANRLEEQFDTLAADADAPLLNRATQGQYQPGLLLGPPLLAAAADAGLLRLGDVVPQPDRPVRVNGSSLRCLSAPPQPATWADVLRLRCPAPFVDLADRLGPAGLEAAFAAFGLARDPVFELDTATSAEAPLADPLLAGIGQENLSLTPLQVALAYAALAAEGTLPAPGIGAAVLDGAGGARPLSPPGEPAQATGARAATAVLRALPLQEGVREFSPVVLSGPEGRANAWYTGIWSGPAADYVAVVVLEDNAAEAEAAAVGRALLAAAGSSEE